MQSITTQFVLYNVRSAAGAWSSFINNQQQFTTASNNVSFNASPAVGVCTSGATTRFFEGFIGRFLLYNKVLSANERTTVLSGFSSKYRLTMS